MSIMSSLFFIILFFASMHANSEARYIGLGRSNKGFSAVFPHPDKGQFLVVEKLRLGMDSSTKGSVLVEQDDDDLAAEQKGTDGGTVFSSPTTTKGIMEYAGSEVFESSRSSSSAYLGLQKDKATTTTNEESRRRGLYAKESRQTAYKVEDDDDGVVLEDYKPPHQTPPIHNKRT